MPIYRILTEFGPLPWQAGVAVSVSSVSASACQTGGRIGVNPGELALVKLVGTKYLLSVHFELM